MKKKLGPVIRLGAEPIDEKRRGAKSVNPVSEPKPSIFGDAPDEDAEEHRRAGERAQELFRAIVRRVVASERD
jgi:hypothetical protein